MIGFRDRLAIVAGEGLLPLSIIEKLLEKGESPLVYAMREDWRDIEAQGLDVVAVEKLNLLKIFASFKLRGVKRLLLAGYVPKKVIYDKKNLDKEASVLIENLDDCSDHSLLAAVIDRIEKLGISVLGYEDIVPEMIAASDHIAGPSLVDRDRADISYGVKILARLLPLSFGQSIVVSSRSVVAVEAMEGTDETIKRAGTISGRGVLIKGMRSDQDRRYDIPVVGLSTLEAMKEAGLSCLAVEKRNTLILNRELFSKKASELSISVVGIEPCRSF